MKKNFAVYLIFVCIFSAPFLRAQSVAINDDGSQPDASSILDLKSSTKGLLIPRMTTALRNLIPSPAAGLMVYDTDMSTFFYYNGGAWVEVAGGGSASLWSHNGTNIFNTNADNVGIGTDDPLAKLHIRKDNEAMIIQGTTPYISFYDNSGAYKGFLWQGPGNNMSIGTAAGNSTGRLLFYNDNILNLDISKSGFMKLSGASPSIELIKNGNSSGEIIGQGGNMEIHAFRTGSVILTPGNLILQTGIVNQFSNLQAGLVGIGTFTPGEKLSVVTASNDYGISHTGGSIKLATYVGGSGNGGYIGTVSNHPLYFYANNGAALMTVLPNGNVGIGTINPTQKLAVNGSIRSKEVVVESGWADYVFEKNYKLPLLDELEKFIQKNKHLPNIPSAKEIEENGLHLGDIQRRMMEKIEELTLYVIELKKEIENLKTRQ